MTLPKVGEVMPQGDYYFTPIGDGYAYGYDNRDEPDEDGGPAQGWLILSATREVLAEVLTFRFGMGVVVRESSSPQTGKRAEGRTLAQAVEAFLNS